VEVRIEADVAPYSATGPLKAEGGSYVLATDKEGELWASLRFPGNHPHITIKVYYESQLVDETVVNPKGCVAVTLRPSEDGKVVGLVVENLCEKEVEVPIKVVGEGATESLKRSTCVEKVAKLGYARECVEWTCAKWLYASTCAKKRVTCVDGECEERCELKLTVPTACEKWACSKTQMVPTVKYECTKHDVEAVRSSWPPSGEGTFEGILKLGPKETKALRFVFKGGARKAIVGEFEAELPGPPPPPFEVNYLPMIISLVVIVFSLSVLLTS